MDFIAEAKSMMNAFPVGDPADLERYARQLDSAAEQFADAGNVMVRLVDNGGLICGPLASRKKNEVRLIDQRVRSEFANRARSLADEVRVQARQLRTSQSTWKSELSRLTNRLEYEFRAKEGA